MQRTARDPQVSAGSRTVTNDACCGGRRARVYGCRSCNAATDADATAIGVSGASANADADAGGGSWRTAAQFAGARD